jgi:TolB protein
MRKNVRFLLSFILAVFICIFNSCATKESKEHVRANEKHLANIRMLTTEGENAEAYFSFDQSKLIFQSRHGQYRCDQIFSMNLDGTDKKLLSTGLGKTTCSFFFPDNQTFIYASTHGGDSACPPPPDYSRGYVWPVYSRYELYVGSPDKQLFPRMGKKLSLHRSVMVIWIFSP